MLGVTGETKAQAFARSKSAAAKTVRTALPSEGVLA
jgi:hypothetical protein